ncbi:hypothetical protein BH10PSE14_BH10PSE14_04700 [soil metagenome]
MPGGGVAIICSPTRRCACGKRATLLCDWKVPTRKSGTCDAPLCAGCSTSPVPDKDLCAKHATAFAQWKAARPIAGAGEPH